MRGMVVWMWGWAWRKLAAVFLFLVGLFFLLNAPLWPWFESINMFLTGAVICWSAVSIWRIRLRKPSHVAAGKNP